MNQKGDRFSEQSIRRMLKKYTRQAGISRNITPHMFRHSFATYLIEEGVDISCVQQMNVFLYFPLGLTLSVLTGPWSVLMGFVLSLSIYCRNGPGTGNGCDMQYAWSGGWDDSSDENLFDGRNTSLKQRSRGYPRK